MLDALEVILVHIRDGVLGGKSAESLNLFILCEFKLKGCLTDEQFLGFLNAPHIFPKTCPICQDKCPRNH